MQEIVYRTATIDDVDAIVALINLAFRPAPDAAGWTSESAFVEGERTHRQEILGLLAQERSAFLLALQGERLVGCYFVDGREPVAYLGMFAVDPVSQGKGIGKSLRMETEAFAARQWGVTGFRNLVLAPRKELIAYNRRRGFLQTGRAFPYPAAMGIGRPKQKNLMMLEMHKPSAWRRKRALKILFSRRPEWEQALAAGLKGTPHTATFAEPDEQNIRQHDVVVPLTMPALEFLAQRRDVLAASLIPLPAPAVVRLCDDKMVLNRVLVEKGFGRFVPRMREPFAFPYVLKKRKDEWGVNTHVIHDAADEGRYADQLASPDYFRQVFIPGRQQYATHILIRNGLIDYATSYQYTFTSSTPVQGQDAIECREPFECPYLVLFRSMLVAIGFEGLCCIDYKILDNTPFVLEINPRFGASMMWSFHDLVERIA